MHFGLKNSAFRCFLYDRCLLSERSLNDEVAVIARQAIADSLPPRSGIKATSLSLQCDAPHLHSHLQEHLHWHHQEQAQYLSSTPTHLHPPAPSYSLELCTSCRPPTHRLLGPRRRSLGIKAPTDAAPLPH